MNKVTLSFLVCAVICRQVSAGDVGPVGAFIRANLVGQPLLHAKQTWIFDPDESMRRRTHFIENHGDKGKKLIEKLGLGVDGNADERLKMQKKRDEGHLGGLNDFLP